MGAMESDGIFWTDVYEFFTDKAPGITAAQKVVDANGKFLGVFGIDVRLTLLSDFLSTLKVGNTGLAFIINSKKQIVAFPKNSPMAKQGEVKQGLKAIDQMGLGWLDALGEQLRQKQEGPGP